MTVAPPTVAPPKPPAVAAVKPPPPIKISVSDAPDVRITQLDGFFRRNPGFAKTSGMRDAIVGAFAGKKKLDWIAFAVRPTELGHGQAIHDQMGWQIRTGRQPDNPWWMRMNKQTVLDPLTAEAHVRAGRESELSTKSEKAWAKYIKRSDQIRAALKIDPTAETVLDKNGQMQPIAVSDAYKGASFWGRMKAKWWLIPQAKQTFWKAHVASLHEARKVIDKQFVEMDKRSPTELQMSSGFRNFVDGYILLNPPTVGGFTRLSQRVLLPEIHPTELSKLPLRQKIAFRLMTLLDPTYELDKARIAKTGPTKVEDAAAA